MILQVIIAFGVGRVIKSNDTNYSEGDIVVSPVTPLAEYCVVSSQSIARKIHPNSGISTPEYISLLGKFLSVCFPNSKFSLIWYLELD